MKYDEPANDEEYLLILSNGLSANEEDGDQIGVYQLVRVTRAKITRELAQ